jgi:hypothetical protein
LGCRRGLSPSVSALQYGYNTFNETRYIAFKFSSKKDTLIFSIGVRVKIISGKILILLTFDEKLFLKKHNKWCEKSL